MNKKLLLSLITVFILIFFLLLFGLYQAKYFIGRASVTQTQFSINNSYLFLTPLRAKANGLEKIRITIFLLNDQGLGVLGKKVKLSQSPNIKQESIQEFTDEYGKSFFDVSSNVAGEYFLDVEVDSVVLPQKARLSFY